MKMTTKLIITFLIIITLFTRFYQLETVPNHLGNDEISIAYDAYSIIRTGRDEHGNYLPLSFQSHNTYKAPLYGYLTAPLTLILPNTATTVRLPSALAGSLTVLVLGLLVLEMTGNLSLSLISSGFLATNPWHIYASRTALESNLSLLFLTLGIYLFLLGVKRSQNQFFLLTSVFNLALSMYAYHTEWVITPLIFAFLVLSFRPKRTLLLAAIFLLLASPLFFDYYSRLGTSARANTELLWQETFLKRELEKLPPLEKLRAITKTATENYLDHLSPKILFFDGLTLLSRDHAYQPGLFLSLSLPFFFLGWFKLKPFRRYQYFVLFFALLSPLMPSITQGGINQNRYLPAVVAFTLLIAAGFYFVYQKSKPFLKIVLLSALSLSFFYFWIIYLYHFPIYSAEGFQYGYQQMAEYIRPIRGQYDHIVVEPRFSDFNRYVGVPHLYLSYYLAENPSDLLTRRNDDQGTHFGKYRITEVNWNLEEPKPKSLYLLPMGNLPPDNLLELLVEISLPDGKPAFKIYKSKN